MYNVNLRLEFFTAVCKLLKAYYLNWIACFMCFVNVVQCPILSRKSRVLDAQCHNQILTNLNVFLRDWHMFISVLKQSAQYLSLTLVISFSDFVDFMISQLASNHLKARTQHLIRLQNSSSSWWWIMLHVDLSRCYSPTLCNKCEAIIRPWTDDRIQYKRIAVLFSSFVRIVLHSLAAWFI